MFIKDNLDGRLCCDEFWFIAWESLNEGKLLFVDLLEIRLLLCTFSYGKSFMGNVVLSKTDWEFI